MSYPELTYVCAADVPKVYRYSCYYWLPVAVLLLCFSLQRGILSRLLSHRLLVIGGEVSYSFYLIHLLVLTSYVRWQQTASVHPEWWVAVPALFVVILLLSLLSYYLYEKPANRFVKKLLNYQSI